jgi:hypothetical protein
MRKQMVMSFRQSQQSPNVPEEMNESTKPEEKGLDSMAGFSGKSSLSLLEEALVNRSQSKIDAPDTISDEERQKVLESIPLNTSLIGDLI